MASSTKTKNEKRIRHAGLTDEAAEAIAESIEQAVNPSSEEEDDSRDQGKTHHKHPSK